MEHVVRLLSTLALKGAIRRLAGQYRAAAATQIDADFAPTLGLLERLRKGETADVVILTKEGLDELVAEGTVAAESKVELARSYVGIAVKAGDRHPDIATAQALRTALLGARSVVYSKMRGRSRGAADQRAETGFRHRDRRTDPIRAADARGVFGRTNGGVERGHPGRCVAEVSRVERDRAGAARVRTGALNLSTRRRNLAT